MRRGRLFRCFDLHELERCDGSKCLPIKGSLNEVGQKRLKISQRAWITFRDAQADFDCHHFDGGSFEGLERIGSLDQLTQARTKRLLADYKRFKEIFE